jgi:hypothetical protein
MEISDFGKLLLVLGLVIVAVGALLTFAGNVPFVGRLPGDIVVRGDRWTFYFPLATSILISLILTLVLFVFGALSRR